MTSAIAVHPDFDGEWPFAADHARRCWSEQDEVEFVRLGADDRRRVSEVLRRPAAVTRLLALGVPVTEPCLEAMPELREVVITGARVELFKDSLERRRVRRIIHGSEGFWGESVAEYGLAMTLCGLRRIPQLHHEMMTSELPWNYAPQGGIGRAGARGHQFGDDPEFTNGTVEGKRVRIVGAGNIGSRYASFVKMLGADVASWDPFASDPCFHLAGARREYFLDRLVQDAEIFAPMLPLTEGTRGIVTAEHIDALPRGCLVVLVTRARICDVDAIRRRVMNDEIALAADVFDVEPLNVTDLLIGRRNVVHTPHNAGRTRQANEKWTEALLMQFEPVL